MATRVEPEIYNEITDPPLTPGQIKTFPLTPPIIRHRRGDKKGGDRGDRGINPLLDRRSFADRSPESSLIIGLP
jgi:hypothetical protein